MALLVLLSLSAPLLPHSSFETLIPGEACFLTNTGGTTRAFGGQTRRSDAHGGPCSEVLSSAASTGTIHSFFAQPPLVSGSALASVGSCAAPWSRFVCAANPRHCWRSPTMCANMGAADHCRPRDVEQSAPSLRATPRLRAMPRLMRAHSQLKSVRKVVFGLDWRILFLRPRCALDFPHSKGSLNGIDTLTILIQSLSCASGM